MRILTLIHAALLCGLCVFMAGCGEKKAEEKKAEPAAAAPAPAIPESMVITKKISAKTSGGTAKSIKITPPE